MKLTAEEFSGLRLLNFFAGKGFNGPRPGSNTWPLVQVETKFGAIDGEIVDALERKGLLTASPRPSAAGQLSANMDGERVDIDLDHRWHVAEAGRAALAARGGE